MENEAYIYALLLFIYAKYDITDAILVSIVALQAERFLGLTKCTHSLMAIFAEALNIVLRNAHLDYPVYTISIV